MNNIQSVLDWLVLTFYNCTLNRESISSYLKDILPYYSSVVCTIVCLYRVKLLKRWPLLFSCLLSLCTLTWSAFLRSFSFWSWRLSSPFYLNRSGAEGKYASSSVLWARSISLSSARAWIRPWSMSKWSCHSALISSLTLDVSSS